MNGETVFEGIHVIVVVVVVVVAVVVENIHKFILYINNIFSLLFFFPTEEYFRGSDQHANLCSCKIKVF